MLGMNKGNKFQTAFGQINLPIHSFYKMVSVIITFSTVFFRSRKIIKRIQGKQYCNYNQPPKPETKSDTNTPGHAMT